MTETNSLSKYMYFGDEALLALLFQEADRLPRAVIDEFIRRKERLITPLSKIVSEQYNWIHGEDGWWAVVHAVYILGAIGTKETIIPLLRALRWADAYDCDWVSGELPSIFSKIDVAAMPYLKNIISDVTSGSHTRSVAIECLSALTVYHPELEQEVFPFICSIMKDSSDDEAVREIAGHILLDFKRQEYREDLLDYAMVIESRKDKEPFYAIPFNIADINRELAEDEKDLYFYTRDWLTFYDEDNIKSRQERWEKEATERQAEEADLSRVIYSGDEPYIRKERQVGRNEPCPCGSGRKYKKCCAEKDTFH